MPYAILRVKKLKSAGAVQAVGEHLVRGRATPNADPERECRTLIGVDDPWEGVQNRIASVEAKIRKNAVLACEVFVGTSPEYFRPEGGPAGTWDEKKLQAWVPTALLSLQREWGAENLIGVYLHLDEATPHIQAIAVPIDPDTNRLNASRWLDGRKAMAELQDRHAQDVKPLGLERGIRGSQATHTEVREWYGQMHAQVKGVPTPRVQAPPLQLSGRNREEWAAEETERLKGTLREPLLHLQAQARAYQEADAKRTEYEATAKQLAKELEDAREELTKLRSLAEVMRGMPLHQVAAYFDDGELEETGLRIGQDDAGRERVFDGEGKVVGRNAIDLVMRATKEDFAGAVTWLAGRGGPAVAQRATIGSAIDHAQHAVEQGSTTSVSPPVIQKRLNLALERGRRRKVRGYRGWSNQLKRHGFQMHFTKDSLSFLEVFSRILVPASAEQVGVLHSSLEEMRQERKLRSLDRPLGPSH